MIWEEIQKMRIGRILKEVKPVGGYEKSLAVLDIARKLGVPLSEVMYVGDSITDIDAFRSVRKSGGLTVSFNGNNYAVREAEVGVTSPSTDIMDVIALDFSSHGKKGVMESVKRQPRAEIIDDENREDFSKHSSRFRKTVRGEAIGKLG
jgi:energy-converting hydrogenase A subunit R